MKIAYCWACARRHKSTQCHQVRSEHGKGRVVNRFFCHQAYVRYSRNFDCEDMRLPVIETLMMASVAVDATGMRINSLLHRHDIQAITDAASHLRRDPFDKGWSDTRYMIYALGFAWCWYFSWPMQSMLKKLLRMTPQSMTPRRWSAMSDSIMREFHCVRVRSDGRISSTNKGISSLKNPNERNCGSVRFLKLSRETKSWLTCCGELSTTIPPRSLVTDNPCAKCMRAVD